MALFPQLHRAENFRSVALPFFTSRMSRDHSVSPSPHPPACWLPTGAEAYARMLEVIARAQHSIRLETYIYRADRSGERFRVALIGAAQRGVRVHVLIDGFGAASLPFEYWRELEEAGGIVHVFNPLSLRGFGLRNHRKLLLVDDALAIVGGFNIGDEYSGDGVETGWRDLGVELYRPRAIRQLAGSFDEIFRDNLLRRMLRHPLQRFPWRRNPAFGQKGPVLFSGPFLRNQFRIALLSQLKRARHVQIVCAYFVPNLRLRRALRAVALRGGTVELVLAAKTDVPPVQAASRSLYGPLLRAGVRIWEYQPQILHTKLAIVDGVVFAGTSNLDARSFAINYELMVRLRDARVVAEAREIFAADRSHSAEITLAEWKKSRTWLTRLRGACARFLVTKIDPWVARRQLRRLT